MRIDNPSTLMELEVHAPRKLGEEVLNAPALIFEPVMTSETQGVDPGHVSADSARERAFLRDLYHGTGAFADGTAADFLAAIHVRTRLDDAILQHVQNGWSVVLTGNPGDGKTHLLRRLHDDLLEACPGLAIELDASTVADDAFGVWWRDNEQQGRQFCVAVNEAVLFNLSRLHADILGVQEAWRQVREAVRYGEVKDDERHVTTKVIVFDLGRRNLLDRSIVSLVLDHLNSDGFGGPCGLCANIGCDYVRARAVMAREGSARFRERLQGILDRVAAQGYHATQRELIAFVAYLMHGNRDCAALLRTSADEALSLSNLVFTGEGALFSEVRRVFDPATITDPVWDERLISGVVDRAGWADGFESIFGSAQPNQMERISTLKRAFYLLHRDGEHLLRMADSDEREFLGLLNGDLDRAAVRKIIAKLNSFFSDPRDVDGLTVWQSHRYNQSPRRMLLSIGEPLPTKDFELVRPRLSVLMSADGAMPYAVDHLLLRHKKHHDITLRIDFGMFSTLQRAERGEPVRSLETSESRRLWVFMEQLFALSREEIDDEETSIRALDLELGVVTRIVVDRASRSYRAVKRDEKR